MSEGPRKRRILILAHAHPSLSKGGAELAARQMYEEYARRPDWEAWLVAAHQEPGLMRPGALFTTLPGGRELLMNAHTDGFLFSAQELRGLALDFVALLKEIQPDVVHAHHYTNLGVETLRAVRTHVPQARLALTLHEYLAICAQNGQMLKTNGELCERESPAECHICLPGRSPQDYFLRKSYIQSFFGLVDAFIAPSHFLKQRYVAWGLPAQKIHVIENGRPGGVGPAPERPGVRGRRFAYFGQITPFKGLELLLDAWSHLPRELASTLSLTLHGGGHDRFGEGFQTRIEQALRTAPAEVRHVGSYATEDLPVRMHDIDWVIVPSTWWENSPLVIQEAFSNGRPVICAGIGGMAEKVRDDVDGLHFPARSALGLARVIERAANEPGLWNRLAAAIRAPTTIADTVDVCIEAYALTAVRVVA